MVIIAPIIVAFVWYLLGSLFYFLYGIALGILIEFYGLYGIIMYRLKTEKTISEEDKDLKRNYYKSLLMVIFTPTIAILGFICYFTGFLLGLLVIVPLGIIIGLYGLYCIYLYKSKPETYREIIEKKMRGENIRNRGIIKIIIGIILVTTSGLLEPPEEYGSQEYEDYIRTLRYLSAFTRLFTQIGLVLFCLSTFLGAMIDRDLSDGVRRGMVSASGIGILGLALLMIFQNLFVGLF